MVSTKVLLNHESIYKIMSAFILIKKIEAYFYHPFSQTTILKTNHIYFEFVGCQ